MSSTGCLIVVIGTIVGCGARCIVEADHFAQFLRNMPAGTHHLVDERRCRNVIDDTYSRWPLGQGSEVFGQAHTPCLKRGPVEHPLVSWFDIPGIRQHSLAIAKRIRISRTCRTIESYLVVAEFNQMFDRLVCGAEKIIQHLIAFERQRIAR